jgi:hypothetical protein
MNKPTVLEFGRAGAARISFDLPVAVSRIELAQIGDYVIARKKK